MIRPVDAPVSQQFGENPTKYLPWDSWLIRTFGNYQPDGHSGQDYACKAGTPVRAVADGVVLHIGWMGGTYADNPWWVQPGFAGYVAVIDHGSFIAIYGHCLADSAKVRAGQHVTQGQVFILSGNTGASTGDHLHFEILPKPFNLHGPMYGRIDPEPFFTSIQVQGAVAPEEGFLMALSDQDQDNIYKAIGRIDQWITGGGPKAAVLDALDDPEVLDRIALAVLKRDCYLVDPATGQVNGTTTLARKINWMAHNDQAILNAIVAVSKKLDVAHPELPAEATIVEDVA